MIILNKKKEIVNYSTTLYDKSKYRYAFTYQIKYTNIKTEYDEYHDDEYNEY